MPILRRALALLMAVALVAAGVFLVVEVVAAWVGSDPVLLSDTATTTWRTTAWDDDAVIVSAIVVGIVGLLCLIVALWPDTPDNGAEHGRPGRGRATSARART